MADIRELKDNALYKEVGKIVHSSRFPASNELDTYTLTSKLEQLIKEKQIQELRRHRSFHLDEDKPADFKDGFREAIDQMHKGDVRRIAELEKQINDRYIAGRMAELEGEDSV